MQLPAMFSPVQARPITVPSVEQELSPSHLRCADGADMTDALKSAGKRIDRRILNGVTRSPDTELVGNVVGFYITQTMQDLRKVRRRESWC